MGPVNKAYAALVAAGELKPDADQARAVQALDRFAHGLASSSNGFLNGLRASIGNLFAVAEQYPDLKTNETFMQLQTRITGLENAIADRREFYNESATINNVRIQQFPDNILAGVFSFPAAPMLHFARSEITDVDVSTLFK